MGQRTNRGITLATTAALCSALVGSAGAARGDAGDVTRGRTLYVGACAPCHGVRGDGRGPVAAYYDPPPRDFTRGVYKLRTTPTGDLALDGDLERTISRGVPGTAMPAWGRKLPRDDIRALVAYVESFSPKFAAPDRRATPVELPAVAPPAKPDLVAGRALFVAFRCWECHGESGRGDGPAAAGLKDDVGRPIRPADLTRGRYRSGRTSADLFRTVATGISGTPMPMYRDTVVVGGDGLSDLGEHASKLAPETRKQVIDFVATLPRQDAVDALSDRERRALGDGRLWLVVAYIRSLSAWRGPFDYVFDDAAGRLP